MKHFCTLIFSFLSLGLFAKEPLEKSIDFVVDTSRRGEISMAQGVQKMLQKKAPKIKTRYIEIKDGRTKLPASHKESVYVFFGQPGLKLMKKLKGQNHKAVHIAHLLFDMHQDLLDGNNQKLFFLPAFLKTGELHSPEMLNIKKSPQIRWMNGVPSNMAFEHEAGTSNMKTFLEKHAKILKNKKPVTVILLAGDAEKADGSVTQFTTENAEKLAKKVAELSPENPLIVMSGPRTGKYQTGKKEGKLVIDKAAHTKVLFKDTGASDPVTHAFLKKVKSLSPERTVILEDFIKGKTSHYKGVFHLLKERGGQLFVNGESNSSIQDAIDLGLISQAHIYRHGAMNPSHHFNVSFVKARYNARVLAQDFTLEPQGKINHKKVRSPCETVAGELIMLFAR